ncbi:MAG: hypothetical protein WDN31_17710 [Hyphomicrobium sp.]
MQRFFVIAFAGACAAAALPAGPGRFASPAISGGDLPCAVEQPSEKYALGSSLEEKICSKVLAKQGTHQSCQVLPVPEGGKCDGAERTVNITDYQRAMSASGEATYEVGAFEIARRNVHDTWLCVTSMFKDC